MKIKLPFDEIYILHLSKSKDREHLINNIKSIIENNIIIRENTSIPFEQELTTYMCNKFNYTSEYGKRPSVFNTTLNHYLTIKQAYERDLNTILIMEDDLVFNTSINLQDYFNINNFPNDWDILRWTCHFFNELKSKHSNIYNNYFIKHTSQDGTKFGNIACYALNRNGMKHYINYIDTYGYKPADHPMMFYDFNKIHQYFANTTQVCCGISDNRNNVNYVKNTIQTTI